MQLYGEGVKELHPKTSVLWTAVCWIFYKTFRFLLYYSKETAALLLFFVYLVVPKTPKIVNVTVNHGHVGVKWKTNMEGVRDELTAVVTYYKKEDPEKVGSDSLEPISCCFFLR